MKIHVIPQKELQGYIQQSNEKPPIFLVNTYSISVFETIPIQDYKIYQCYISCRIYTFSKKETTCVGE